MSSSPAYGLALHTSSPELGLALGELTCLATHDRTDLRIGTWNWGREVSSRLHQGLADFLPPQTWCNLAFVAVARGPGGFTGTRMGVVTARTLAQQLQVPLFGISSLGAIAAAQPESTDCIALQMPAQRGELFVAVYQANHPIDPIVSDRVISPTDWQIQLARLQQPYHLVQAPTEQGRYVEAVLDLAYDRWCRGERCHWSATLPFYGQHPIHQ